MPSTRLNPSPAPTRAREKKSLCPVVVSYGRKAGHECCSVAAQKCANNLCSKHCPYKGGCNLHPAPTRHHASDAADVARWIEPTAAASEPDFPASEVHLPMPQPTPSELEAREHRELREAIDESLRPTLPDHLPPFASNLNHSASSSAPTLSFIPYVPSYQTGPFITAPTSKGQSLAKPTRPINPVPPTSSVTSTDRAKQRAMHLEPDGVIVDRLPPALSQHMSKEWTEQTVKRQESQAQAQQDQTLQQSLARQGQHEFRLGYFPAVCSLLFEFISSA